MSSSPIISLNGHLLPAEYARISPLDYSFMYGFSLFETLRSYDGRLFRLEEHLARLRKSARTLGISPVPEDTEIERSIRQVLQGNNLKDARIRLTLSPGEGNLSPEPSSCRNPVFLVAASSYSPPGDNVYEQGYRAIISKQRRDSSSILCRIKSGNYLASLLAREEARQRDAEIAILLNERGALSESQMANLFLVKERILITPDANSGILPGVTRAEVLKLGPALGLKVEVREVKMEELYEAEEVFITSSLLEIMPLANIEGHVIARGFSGEVTRKLRDAYREAVSSAAF